ncbi:ATP-NAD kinase [Halorubellus sp. JP-L1]|uniref:NAD(+)/NADH kinase n=1 Tax=Halorubellus sp. JP-L1 TaxID=2715753 RepID=UPI00140E668B|nr:NAD(+)/NADH kinase [Halorubellus sp. JP-L1]NHN42313.1 ATP-NAD kinase [Halorubellus sp. JP-L1]
MDDSKRASTVVGIVDVADATAPDVSALAAAVDDATALVDDARALATADVDAVVARGERSLYECVRARVDAPVLPIDTDHGTHGVPHRDAAAAIAALVADTYETTTRTTLAVATETIEPVRALADVTLVTSEPARISEYTLTATDRIVGRFRADGVVLATPVGSQGYARAAGSHVLAPHTGVLAAVPIAPFATNADDWIVPDDDVSLTVERDEGDVSLRIDDRHVTTVGREATVDVTTDDPLTLAITPQSTGPWPHALEKH